MSFYPSFTPYQIPFEPLINTTRLEIQRSLSTLQQKLRRRKEIDLQTQLHLQSQLYKPTPPQNYYEALRNIEQRDRVYSHLAQDEIYHKQALNDVHFNRIEELKMERDRIVNQNAYARTFSVSVNEPEMVSPSDQQLIKKYENGSKAIEYYRDLQKQQSKSNLPQARTQQQIPSIKVNTQKQLFKSQRKNQGILGLQSAKPKASNNKLNTPYDFIKYAAEESKLKEAARQKQQNEASRHVQKQRLAKELEKEFAQLQFNDQKKHMQSTFKATEQNYTNRDTSPVKFLKDQSPHKKPMQRYSSLGKMPCNRSRTNLSSHHASILNEPYLKSKSIAPDPKLTTKQIEYQAIKKIQNRLKVSKVIYQDSQFRNKKYEENHLFNTFEMEIKLRNQVRQKINGHPVVLKKHALIVQ